MLPVLGIIFGLFVAFTAAQVWGDSDRASAAVSREASALRAPCCSPPACLPSRRRGCAAWFVDYVEQAVNVEWPMMAHQAASLKATPPALAEALQLVVAMTPQGAGQQTAQREIIAALQQRWTRGGNGSSSAMPKSIRSNGGACICRRPAHCW